MEAGTEDNLLDTLRQRLPFVLLALLLLSLALMMRLTALAIGALSAPDAAYVDAQRAALYEATVRFQGARGTIYDRNGAELAVNQSACTVAINPPLISEPLVAARALSPLLDRSVRELYDIADGDRLWQSLVSSFDPLPGETCQQLDELAIYGVEVIRLQRRSYPQGRLAAQIIGFINFDTSRPSGFGIEGYYHNLLAGSARDAAVSADLYDSPPDQQSEDRGRDLVLTIDRDLQFLAEERLGVALEETGSIGGTVIIMDVATGEVLAMANLPGYDPNHFYDVEDPQLLANAAISESYEPGVVVIPLTLAGALEQDSISPRWRYLDRGELIFSGQRVVNADLFAYGEVGVDEILLHGTHIGAAEVAIEMGASAFYEALGRFGLGETTGIDLAGETSGELRLPGHPEWSDNNLLRNAYGQLMEVTPLQLAANYAALANEGLMLQPHIVAKIIDHSKEEAAQHLAPSTLAYGKRVVSAETANYLLHLLARNISGEIASLTEVPGYSLAGMLAKAAIPDLTGYRDEEYVMTFVGMTPAQDPELVFLLKLDQPKSDDISDRVLGPTVQRLLEGMVVLLEMPPDEIRESMQNGNDHPLAEQ